MASIRPVFFGVGLVVQPLPFKGLSLLNPEDHPDRERGGQDFGNVGEHIEHKSGLD
jgi:hypothetical protein